MFPKRQSDEVAAVAVPIEVVDDPVATAGQDERPRGRRARRAVASLGLAGLAWRAAQDDRMRKRTRELVSEVDALRGRRERLRRQRRRKRAVTGVVASAGVTAGAVAASRALRDGVIEESIVVDVPVSRAYNQWTQFEEFPKFMNGVNEVRQLDDARLHWVASIGGQTREWDAEISEQRPDERIAWHATTGKRNAGVVTFHRLSDDRSKLLVQLDFEPSGIRESLGRALRLDRRRVRGDLRRFKELIESRGTESGAWRGRIERGETRETS